MLKQVWKDPVWAAVIATGLTAVFGALGTYLLGYWPAIQEAFISTKYFFVSSTPVSNWILMLMAIPCLLVAILLVALLWQHWFTPNEIEPNWAEYIMDNFFGLRWRWQYVAGSINRLVTFCPHCDYQVFPMNASAYDAIGRISYKCDSCHADLGLFNESREELHSKVERFIQQKIRTESWKEANRRLSS